MTDIVTFLRARLEDAERRIRHRMPDPHALADIEIKRAIINIMIELPADARGLPEAFGSEGEIYTEVLCHLASADKGHPDYRPEWVLDTMPDFAPGEKLPS